MRTSTLVRIWIAGALAAAAAAGSARAQCVPTAVISSVTRTPANAARVYSLANLVEGDHYFSDRNNPGSHILTSVPPQLRCAQWVKTPNDDKDETSLALVQLQLSQPSVVYVGLDNRAAAGPTWLTSAFQNTGLGIGIAETGTQTSFRVWKRAFPAGTHFLGGNSAAGSSFPSGKSNYIALALPDPDGDGFGGREDNCPDVANPTQADSEVDPQDPDTPQPDGVGDACDNCPGPVFPFEDDPLLGRDFNTAQLDVDGDGIGDTCDDDIDGDGVLDVDDNCLYTPNPGQEAGSGSAGAACELPGLPYEAHGLDVTQVHQFAVDMDSLPGRAEIRIELLPASRNLDVEVDVECSGDPEIQDLCEDGGPTRWDCRRFPRPVAFKVGPPDAGPDEPLISTRVVQPLHLRPDQASDTPPPQPADGEWVVPFFLYSRAELFSPLPDLGVVCFIEIRPLPGGDATGTFGVRLAPRSKPAAAKPFEENQGNLFQGQWNMDTVGEYGFFTPLGTNFTLLNSGNPALGQCVLDDPENGDGRHIPVAGARGWNCCTFTYETEEFEFPHGGGFESERGHAAIFVGTTPADPQPDLDADVILNFCDNCLATPNSLQDDRDGDGVGDACDNCRAVSNAVQTNTDSVPAGDDCQCADVNTSGAANLVDVAMMRRFLAGRANPASFSSARCVLAPGPFPCDPLAVLQVRRILAGASPPLVQNCP